MYIYITHCIRPYYSDTKAKQRHYDKRKVGTNIANESRYIISQ